jgi:uncharacterized C2H2 Zn-finger protein
MAKLTWDNEMSKVDEYGEWYKVPQTLSDNVSHSDTSDKESSRPPNSASTAVATESHATLEIKTDVSRRANTLSNTSNPIHDIHDSSESDLTEIEDDDDPLNIPDATAGNEGIIKDDNTFIGAAGVNRRSARRPCPTRRQTLLWEERVNSDEEGRPRRGHSLPPPAKPSSMFTTNARPALPLRATKHKVAKTPRKARQADHAATYDFTERRTSSRLHTAAKKSISFAEYSDKDSDDGHSDTGGHEVATPNIVHKLGTEGKDTLEPDAWKAGWSKSDSWAMESPGKELAVKDEPVATKGKQLPARSSPRSQPVAQAVHKKSHSRTATTRRIVCPKGCGATFGRAHDAQRHANQSMGCGGGQKAYACPVCGSNFTRQDALHRHHSHVHSTKRSASGRH